MRNNIMNIDKFDYVKSTYNEDSRKWGSIEPKLPKIGSVLTYSKQSAHILKYFPDHLGIVQ